MKDCPFFTSNNFSSFQIRSYEGGYWVSINFNSSFEEAEAEGFTILEEFLDGQNSLNTTVRRSAPKINHSKRSFATNSTVFTLSFFLPFEFQDPTDLKKPVPNNKSVYVEYIPPRSVAVICFGGLQDLQIVQQNVKQLSLLLEQNKIAFENTGFIFAGYDPQDRIFDV